MPARYDTIIVVRKRNARGEAVEYHTVGRKGPSIWRTGEPNPPGTPGYQAAYEVTDIFGDFATHGLQYRFNAGVPIRSRSASPNGSRPIALAGTRSTCRISGRATS